MAATKRTRRSSWQTTAAKMSYDMSVHTQDDRLVVLSSDDDDDDSDAEQGRDRVRHSNPMKPDVQPVKKESASDLSVSTNAGMKPKGKILGQTAQGSELGQTNPYRHRQHEQRRRSRL